eukprot:6174352-Pleurochrysis_carterae.AAC.6
MHPRPQRSCRSDRRAPKLLQPHELCTRLSKATAITFLIGPCARWPDSGIFSSYFLRDLAPALACSCLICCASDGRQVGNLQLNCAH